jgi:hypothetical protein
MATRYVGKHFRVEVEWSPRNQFDVPWWQGSYKFLLFDERWAYMAPRSRRGAPPVRMNRAAESGVRHVSRGGPWGTAWTLEQLGFRRPEMPQIELPGREKRVEIVDLRDLVPQCKRHEECLAVPEMGAICGKDTLAWVLKEDAMRDKLLRSPEAYDRATALYLTGSDGAARRVRLDGGDLTIRRTPPK